jgi:hypothetical protein
MDSTHPRHATGRPLPAAWARRSRQRHGRGTLAPYDNVLILKQPEFALVQTVTVAGQVRFPGTYGLASGKDRLADIIDRVGAHRTGLSRRHPVRPRRRGRGRIDVDLSVP